MPIHLDRHKAVKYVRVCMKNALHTAMNYNIKFMSIDDSGNILTSLNNTELLEVKSLIDNHIKNTTP